MARRARGDRPQTERWSLGGARGRIVGERGIEVLEDVGKSEIHTAALGAVEPATGP
jgi:hypothetical protein